MRRIFALIAVLLGGVARADEQLPAGAKVVKLTATPAEATLVGQYRYTQAIVTATFSDGTTCDVTRMVHVTSSPSVKVSPTGVMRPTGDGLTKVKFELQGQTAEISVKPAIRPVGLKTEISFIRDVMPLIGKMGCNAGTCHGAQTGKNGFKLSLRGYDPLADHRSLTDDLEARRFNRAAPERSLMLMKTSGVAPHVGGVLWQPGEPNYEIVRAWIFQGVKFDKETARVKSIELLPKSATLERIGEKQQFAVIAHYPDGSSRDVTLESFVESSNTDVATTDKAALLSSVRRGETTVLARYEGAYAASTVVVMGDRTGFVWKSQPVHNTIDELVDAKLKRIKVQLSEMCTDEEFIRRVTLDLTGLPPTSDDVRSFLKDSKSPKIKREELIDRLIGSEAFVDHWTNKWADLLQVNRKFLGEPGAKALRTWIREAVAKNMPYDEFANALLTGSGSNVEHPAAAYYKILREPDAAMENTTQLFLAIRFNCNKCHDHPFERWTQDNYYSLAAYFAQVSRTEDPKYKGQKIGGTDVEKPKPLVEVIADGKEGETKHLRTGAVSPPKFPFTHADMPKEGEPRRLQAAHWITSAKNPYFAKSYVNRIWSYLLGVGLIEPVDDIRTGNPASNPELLDKLTADFIENGFDTRKLIRTICQSRTYQLSVATNRWNKGDEINYSHAVARRLQAEVLFDAVHAVTGSPSHLPGLPTGSHAAQLIDSNIELPGGFLELLGKPARESVCECERSSTMMLGPVLAFVSGPVVGDAVQDPASRIAKFTEKEKDDAKVVEEIYLSVLSRFPTAEEMRIGIKALRSSGEDLRQLQTLYKQKADAFADYAKTLDSRQAQWETGLLAQKPTAWTTLQPETATAKAAKLAIRGDGSVLASGPTETKELYTLFFELKSKEPVTALRLEALADPTLPSKGPGRADNGNFVLHELKVESTANRVELPKPVPLTKPQATFSQGGFEIAKAVDGNPETGWAVAPQMGRDQTAIFRVKLSTAKPLLLGVTMDQHYGGGHNIGKFRFSYTTDKNPMLASPVSPELAKLLTTPPEERTKEEKGELRKRYLAQDAEHARLKAEAAKKPPEDPRVLGAQDLTWALINSPAFLFNR